MEISNKQIQNGAIAIFGAGLLYYLVNQNTEAFGNGTNDDPTGNGTYTPTLPNFNSKSIADGLLEAMDIPGTDEDAIQDLLKTVTPNQFSAVIKSFGLVPYNKISGSNHSINPFGSLPKLGLKDWLKNEISISEYEIMRKKYPNQL